MVPTDLEDFLKQRSLLLNNSPVIEVSSRSLPRCRLDDVAAQGERATDEADIQLLTRTVGDEVTSDEDECGQLRVRAGQGVLGAGSPLQILVNGKHKPFADGCGLCSPGRWPPEKRSVMHPWLLREWLLHSVSALLSKQFDVKKLVCQFAVNMFQVSPFSESLLAEGRALLCRSTGGCVQELDAVAEGQVFRLRLIGAVLKHVGDPDHGVYESATRNFQTVYQLVSASRCRAHLQFSAGRGSGERMLRMKLTDP